MNATDILGTSLDLTTLEQLDFAPPCEYEDLDSRMCGNLAEWIFVSLGSAPCGCVMPDRFFCTPCKIRRQEYTHLLCLVCGKADIPNDLTTFRFERIDGMS